MKTNPNRPIRYIDWKEFGILIDKLVEKIKNSGYTITSVYGIPRNGMIIATILAKKLDVEFILDRSSITFTTLIVDDISDSGQTLREYKKSYCANRTAAIHKRISTKVIPDIYIEDIVDHWIVYPFENGSSPD